MTRWLDDARVVKRNAGRILYIGRQETLNSDWDRIRPVLGLAAAPPLPTNPVSAHPADPEEDRTLNGAARTALEQWYAKDMKLLRTCDQIRNRRGWGDP